MSLLGATGIAKAYGERILLRDASLTITEGERIGVVGRNGAGKSTLARILAGVEPADSGAIALRKGARVTYLEQDPAMDDAKSAREVAEEGLGLWLLAKERHERATEALSRAEGDMSSLLEQQLLASSDVERLGGWERNHQVERVLRHLGISDLGQRVGTMSGGQRRRIAIARVLLSAPDLMILDEPTNHLDADSIDWLERFIAEEFRGAVVLVTHDRWLLDAVVDRTIEIENGNVVSYEGGYEAFLTEKAERRELEARTERSRQNFLRSELEWLRRQPKARSCKQKARIQRAETARDVRAPREVGTVELTARAGETGKSVLDVRGVELQVGNQVLVRGLDLALTTGDRLGILGPNGIGKSSLLRAITGELAPSAGVITLGKRVRIGYLDQSRSGLDETLSVYDTVAQAVPTQGDERLDPRSYLERFLFDSSSQRKKVNALSGGERARLALARLLASSATLLLLDEPSNDLDIDTLSALEDFLSTWNGCILLVTHDRYLLDRVTTGILAFEGEGRVMRYAGAYQAYAARRDQMEEAQRAERTVVRETPKVEAEASSKPRALSKNEQKVLADLPDKIDAAEKSVTAIEAELGDPALYVGLSDDKAKVVRERLEKARSELDALMKRWEEMEARR